MADVKEPKEKEASTGVETQATVEPEKSGAGAEHPKSGRDA
jgi:hypothetical protein